MANTLKKSDEYVLQNGSSTYLPQPVLTASRVKADKKEKNPKCRTTTGNVEKVTPLKK